MNLYSWSDGLGNNDKENELWRCQLDRMQSLADGIRSGSSSGPTAFWLDTLCVPVGDANRHPGGDRGRDLRKDAISHMARIYRLAVRVLVLDATLLALSRTADLVDKYVQIHLSNWHHRLWTMQEGHLAARLFFQWADGAESFDDMKRAELAVYDGRAARNLCSPVRLLCALELEAFYRDGELAARDVAARMRSCARYLRSRDTSRAEDESVCVASILGLGSDGAREILEQDGADARMARFYDLVGRFDARIIFHNHPRLRTDGYRWAPSSFLRQVPDIIGMRGFMNDVEPPHAILQPGGGGLHVQFGGFEFTTSSSAGLPQPGSPVLIRQQTDGRMWAPRYYGDVKTPWWASAFPMEIHATLGTGRRWAVIWLGCLERDLLPHNMTAVVASIDDDIAPCPARPGQVVQTLWTAMSRYGIELPAYFTAQSISIRYACRATITMPAPEIVSPHHASLAIWAYSMLQEWLLR
jgi:hypothetical protein